MTSPMLTDEAVRAVVAFPPDQRPARDILAAFLAAQDREDLANLIVHLVGEWKADDYQTARQVIDVLLGREAT